MRGKAMNNIMWGIVIVTGVILVVWALMEKGNE